MLPLLLLLLVVKLPLLVGVCVTFTLLVGLPVGLDPPPITEEMAAARAAVKFGSAVSALTVSANDPAWWGGTRS